MASLITHALVPLVLGAAVAPREKRGRFLWASVVCSCLPDADVIGFKLGVAYGDLWGHRGLSHSLLFAACLGAVVVLILFRPPWRGRRVLLWAWFTVITASHGLLDALTDGGLGIAFFSPFDPTRYFLPWVPLAVAPIGIENFFNSRGLEVLASEARWVWGPTLLVTLGLWGARRQRAAGPKTTTRPDS